MNNGFGQVLSHDDIQRLLRERMLQGIEALPFAAEDKKRVRERLGLVPIDEVVAPKEIDLANPPLQPGERQHWERFLREIAAEPPQKRPPPSGMLDFFREEWLPKERGKEAAWEYEWRAKGGTDPADLERYIGVKRAKEERSRRALDAFRRAREWEKRNPSIFFLSPLLAHTEVGEAEAEQRARDIAKETRQSSTLGTVVAPARRAVSLVGDVLSGVGALLLAVPPALGIGEPGSVAEGRHVLSSFPRGFGETFSRSIGYLKTAATKHPELLLHDPARAAFDVATTVPLPIFPAKGFGGVARSALSRAGRPVAGRVAEAALFPIDTFLPTTKNVVGLATIQAPRYLAKGVIGAGRFALSKIRPGRPQSPTWWWKRPGEVVRDFQERVRQAAQDVEDTIAYIGEGIDEAVANRYWREPSGGVHKITARVDSADGTTTIVKPQEYKISIGEKGRLNVDEVARAYEALLDLAEQQKASGGRLNLFVQSEVHPPHGLTANVRTRSFVEVLAALYLKQVLSVMLRMDLPVEVATATLKYAPHTKLFTPELYRRAQNVKTGIYTPETIEQIQEAAVTKRRAEGWEAREAAGKYVNVGIFAQIETQLLEVAGTGEVINLVYESLRNAARAPVTGKTRQINLELLTPEGRKLVVDALGEVRAPEAVVSLAGLSQETRGIIIAHLKNKVWSANLRAAVGDIKTIRQKLNNLVESWRTEIEPRISGALDEAIGGKYGLSSSEVLDAIRNGAVSIRVAGDKASGAVNVLDDIVTTIEGATALEIVSKVANRALGEIPVALGTLKEQIKNIIFSAEWLEWLAGVSNIRSLIESASLLRAFADELKKAAATIKTLTRKKLSAPKIDVTEVALSDLPPGLRRVIRRDHVTAAAMEKTTATAVPVELADAVEKFFYKNQKMGWPRWVGSEKAGKALTELHNTFVRTVLFTPVLGVANKILIANAISQALYLVPQAIAKYRIPAMAYEIPRVMLEYIRLRKLKTAEGMTTYAIAANPDKVVDCGAFGKIQRKRIWNLLETGKAEGSAVSDIGLMEKIPGVRHFTQRKFATGEAHYLTGALSDAVVKEAMFRVLGRSGRVKDLNQAVAMVKEAFGAFSLIPPGVKQLASTFLPFLSWTYYAYPKMADFFSRYIQLAAFYRGVGDALEQGYAEVADIDLERLRRRYPSWFTAMTYMGYDPKRKGHRWVDMSRAGLRNLMFDAWASMIRDPSATLSESAFRTLGTQTWWGAVPTGILLSRLAGEPINVKTGQLIAKKSDPEWYQMTKLLLSVTMPLFAPGEVQTALHWLESRYGPKILKRKLPMRRLAEHTPGEILQGFVLKPPAVYRPEAMRKQLLDVARSRMAESRRPEARRAAVRRFREAYQPGAGVSRPGLVPIETYIKEIKQ